jgi:hypothetical protein
MRYSRFLSRLRLVRQARHLPQGKDCMPSGRFTVTGVRHCMHHNLIPPRET